MKKSDKDLANDIRRRANAANVSISKLCREAGVSRQWYEDLKRRTPQPVDLYLKIDEKLKEYERGEAAPTQRTLPCNNLTLWRSRSHRKSAAR